MIPTPRKKCPSRAPSGAPPEIAAVHRPPSAARSLPYTSLSNTACRSRSPGGAPPVSSAWLYATAVRSATSKIRPLPSAYAFCFAEL